MLNDIYRVLGHIQTILEILLNLHVLALLIINVTKTPSRSFQDSNSYSLIGRIYRLVELLAGLVSPLSKK